MDLSLKIWELKKNSISTSSFPPQQPKITTLNLTQPGTMSSALCNALPTPTSTVCRALAYYAILFLLLALRVVRECVLPAPTARIFWIGLTYV